MVLLRWLFHSSFIASAALVFAGVYAFSLAGMTAFAQRVPLDPMHTVGVESCAECHEEIVESWEQSAHARSYEYLAKTDAAKSIARILGMTTASIMTEASCVRCHYTQETFSGGAQTTAAVSCESCHGSADKWIDEHNRKSLARSTREHTSMSHGMNHPCSIVDISRSCYECHVIDDEQLVNKAGHPAMSRGFEILSWYSGETNHNFMVQKPGRNLKSHSSSLQPIPQARKRMLFLTGKMLHLSQSLKAMSTARDAPVDKSGTFIRLANGKYTYGVQHGIEVQRLLKEIQQIQLKVGIPEYARILALASNLQFSTGNQRQFAEASDEIEKLAVQFCETNDGSKFAVIDPVIARLTPRYSKRLAGAGR